jgi:glycosyltransferase involved in cell wall biosynthesis
MKLSIIVPVFNEVSTIAEILRRVAAVEVGVEKEVIVVDDGSTDGTREVLKRIEGITRIFQEKNRGKGAAISTALGAVTGDVVLIQDADLEYDPAEYPTLLAPILEGRADVVYGSRFLGSPRRVLLFWHTAGNKFLTLMSNMLTNLNLTDMETGYKVFLAEILQKIPLRSDGFDFEPEVTARIARRRLRIYEVPISYAGRTYAEGKKIHWKDGIAALWAILRYNLIDDSPAGEKTLRRVSYLTRYNNWLWEQVAPFIGQRVLEVGAGIGTMTRYLLGRDMVVATDVSPIYLERLKATFEGHPDVVVKPLDAAAPLAEGLQAFNLDTILCLNVLEHIEDDEAALKGFAALLAPGGRVVLIIPALKRLYGEIDKAIGHYRRYQKGEIEEKLRRAGFHIEETRFFNTLGIPGWYLNSCLLKRQAVPGFQARLNDLLVPLLRFESNLALPWGMSLLAVGRKA